MEIQDLLKRPELLDKLGIQLSTRTRTPGGRLNFLKMSLYVKASDLLDFDADYRSVLAHASTDPIAMKYCTDAINAKVGELLKELPNE